MFGAIIGPFLFGVPGYLHLNVEDHPLVLVVTNIFCLVNVSPRFWSPIYPGVCFKLSPHFSKQPSSSFHK